MSREARVGALVLALFALLLWLSPGSSQRPPVLGSDYNLVFDDVGGLRESDLVKVAGVNAGRVAAIDFTTRTMKEKFGEQARVVVRVAMDLGVSIPEDSRYSIETDISGQRWVEITPGGSRRVLTPDQLVKAVVRDARMNQFESSLVALKELSVRTEDLRAAMADPTFRRTIKDLASNFRFYSNEFVGISRTANEQVEAMEENLDKQEAAMMAQLDRIDARVAAARERSMELAPQINESIVAWDRRIQASEGELRGMIQSAVEQTERYRELVATAESRVVAGKLDEKVRDEILKLATRIDEIAALASDMHDLTSSPEVKAELLGIVEKYRRQAEDLRRNLERWEKAIP